MVAGRGRRCHPLQVASPELEGILVWGYGVVLGMPRLQYILLDLIPHGPLRRADQVDNT